MTRPISGLLLVALLVATTVSFTLEGASAAPPPPPLNPPTDPDPTDLDPYPPTDAILYYVRNLNYLVGDFTIDIGSGVVSVKLVPKNLEDFAMGYYTEFSPTMTVTDPLKDAMNQPLWPRWFNDTSHGYDPGEEAFYWPGWRFYYEDSDWDVSDQDIDDLWIDIGWQKAGSGILILVKASYNEAVALNPFEITFERQTGSVPVHFSYELNEKASGGGISTGVFVLEDDPVTILVFDSGDWWDWAQFYGSIPVLPLGAMPCAFLVSILVLRKRRAVRA